MRVYLFSPPAGVTVPGNVTSYTLKSLVADTKYDTWVTVSTIKGSKIGITHSFFTQKYGKYFLGVDPVKHLNVSGCVVKYI